MNMTDNALKLQFIEAYLRDGADSDKYSTIKQQLYRNGYNRSQVIAMVVEGELYGNLDRFYRKHPSAR